MRLGQVIVATVTIAGLVAGCSGKDQSADKAPSTAPTSAAPARAQGSDFCKILKSTPAISSSMTIGEYADIIENNQQALKKAGYPADMSKQVRSAVDTQIVVNLKYVALLRTKDQSALISAMYNDPAFVAELQRSYANTPADLKQYVQTSC